MIGKYIVRRAPSGIRFNLVATNGQIIATSEIYSTRAACLGGIDSIRRNAPDAALEDQCVQGFAVCRHPKFEVYRDRSGQFRFRLKARNGEIIAASEGYTTKANCLKGMASLRRNAGAPIAEERDTAGKGCAADLSPAAKT